MPRKLTPEEAAVMIIRRRLQQREEDKMAHPEKGRRDDEPAERDDVLGQRKSQTDKR